MTFFVILAFLQVGSPRGDARQEELSITVSPASGTDAQSQSNDHSPGAAHLSRPSCAVSKITIDLNGAPSGARYSIDRKRVFPPLVLPKSKHPVVIRVEAKGHSPADIEVRPVRNQVLQVSLQRKQAEISQKKSSSNSSKKRKALEIEKRKSGAVWAKNPFGE